MCVCVCVRAFTVYLYMYVSMIVCIVVCKACICLKYSLSALDELTVSVVLTDIPASPFAPLGPLGHEHTCMVHMHGTHSGSSVM